MRKLSNAFGYNNEGGGPPFWNLMVVKEATTGKKLHSERRCHRFRLTVSGVALLTIKSDSQNLFHNAFHFFFFISHYLSNLHVSMLGLLLFLHPHRAHVVMRIRRKFKIKVVSSERDRESRSIETFLINNN